MADKSATVLCDEPLQGALLVHDLPQMLNALLTVPLRRTGHSADFTAIRIDQDSRWNTEHVQRPHDSLGWVDIDRKITQFMSPVKAFNRTGASDINGDRQDADILTAQIARQLIKRGHFLAAWFAPGCPHIDEQILAPKIRQFEGLPFRIRELEVRNFAGCIETGEFPDRQFPGEEYRVKVRNGYKASDENQKSNE